MTGMRDEGNRKRSVRFRLVLMVASLTAAVFLMVILTFNVLISRYMQTNATQVLSQSRQFDFTSQGAGPAPMAPP